MAFPFGQAEGVFSPKKTFPQLSALMQKMRMGLKGRALFKERQPFVSLPKPRPVVFEPLEPRLLLSADLSFAAVTASDLILRLQDVNDVQNIQIVLADEAALGGEIIVSASSWLLTM
ncbi:MAG: LEPR-XLL domain-containing protein, partial [Motiliproteus sp.]